jgi:hypothetical protein
MATSTWSAWDDEVATRVHGARLTFIRHQVKLAAIDFCKRAWPWIVDQGPISIAATQNEYDWEPPANTQIVRVLQAWLDKRPIYPKTRNELSDLYGDYMRADGPTQYYIQDTPNSFILVPRPNSTSSDGVTAKVAIAPKRSATGLDSKIFDRYHDEIADGAVARLLVMSKKPWTDMNLGAAMTSKFDDVISAAKTEIIRSFAGARLRNRAQFY